MSGRFNFRGNSRSRRGFNRSNRGHHGSDLRRKPYYNERFARGSCCNVRSDVSENNQNTLQEGNRDSEENLEQFYKCSARIVEESYVAGPYFAWKMYIPDEEYNQFSPILVKLQALEEYYKRMGFHLNRDHIEESGYFTLNFKNMVKDELLLKGWQTFGKDIQDMPELCLNYLGLGMHQVLSVALYDELKNKSDGCPENARSNTNTTVKFPKINARLIGFEPQLPMKNLKSNCYGKFVCVKGTVIRVSNVKPMCTKLAFKCCKCGKEFVYSQPYGKYMCPVKCVLKGCRGQVFMPLRSSPKTETVNWQSIKIQEISDDQKEVGRMPRSVECELMYDLVDSCVPGDIVSVSGIVNVTSSNEGKSKFSKDKCTYLLYILANSISNCQGNEVSSTGKLSTPIGVDLTVKDLYAVQAIQAEENLLKLLCASLCPSIYGHEMVKAGLILGLFGGTQKFQCNKNRIPVRGDPHILVVGDPGLGKSQMLQACANIAPRGVYVCGNTTTMSGLTVTLSREGGGGDYALEAGALVLADQGCCCIDEFDKMTNQHHALLEAMEQQTISIAKAGIVCSLPARTSILAAANPVGGHYNKSKTVSENLKMGSALLSRFDLVFILLDKPNQELDSKLSEHIMALHSEKSQRGFLTATHLNITQSTQKTTSQLDREKPLAQRLKYSTSEECELIPHQLLRKYIAYARKYVHAKISTEAADVLQKFYLELRKRLQTPDSTPITTRQLESLIRLTEARARLELREVCTKEDAMDVVEIMKQSMIDVWSDNFGVLDITRSEHGSGMSGRSQAKKFISILTSASDQTKNSLFSVQQMKQIAKDAGIRILDFENLLSSLNTQGILIKKGHGIYKLLSADY